MKEYYAFYDLAANPLGSPSSNTMGLAVYSHKDKLDQLPKLAASFANLGTVPLTNVMFPVNSIWYDLRDNHAALQETTFQSVFGAATIFKYVNVLSSSAAADGGNVSAVNITISTSDGGMPVFTNNLDDGISKVNSPGPLSGHECMIHNK